MLFLIRRQLPVVVDPRRILDNVLGVRDADVGPAISAPWSGTKDVDVPKRPVFAVTQLGLPVESST